MDYVIGSTVARAILGSPTLSTICIQTTIQCLQTLAVTTQEIYGFITTIKTTTHHIDITNLLIELDLEPEVLVLESLLKEINIEKHHTQTLAICLKLLEDCLTDILKLLSEVNKRLDYNKKLWVSFYGSRSYKFDDLGNKLRFYKANLDKRKDNLFEIIKINKYLIPSNSPILQLITPQLSTSQLITPQLNTPKQIIHECDDDTLNLSIISINKYESSPNKKSSKIDFKPEKARSQLTRK